MNKPVTAEEIMAQGRREPASHATAIEQSRAVAEVQAAVTVAQARPRDEALATEKAIKSCGQRAVAETAFFKFPRGGQSVQGESVHLARELARCWGNIFYGISELNRDDTAAVSEMVAFAWDLETNAQSRMTFQVPHKRDKRGGAEVLTDMRDIYENNANMGARRLRECIFAVLPPYLKEVAKQACIRTLEKGEDGKPLPVRIAEALTAFERIGISRERVEAKAGRSSTWTEMDVASLQVSYRSISRKEVLPEEEFPRIGVEDTTAAARRLVEDRNADGKDFVSASSPGRLNGIVDDDPGEGRSDEQMGDQHTDDDGLDQSPAAQKARDLIRRAEAAGTIAELDVIEAEADKHLPFMEGDFPAWVNAALGTAAQRLSPKQGA